MLVVGHGALCDLVNPRFECRTRFLRRSETPARFFAAA